MAIPNISDVDIRNAIDYIDTNGIPAMNVSTKYDLVTDDGNRYPPKYVIAVADYLTNGTDIDLVVHSVLHLLGYDHMDEGEMKRQMRAQEEAIMERLLLPR